MKSITQTIGACIMLFALAMAVAPYLPPPTPNPSPGPGPDPAPEPIPAVESPFPAEGFFLLMASQSNDSNAVAIVANTETVRKEPNLENRWHDYDQRGLAEPWQSALDWAKGKANDQPYFVARHGAKASEGPLRGNANEMLATVTKVIEELR